MRGPHNLLRLIRTGATFERTGAMAQVLEAMDAPPRLRAAARLIGWPFRWLGYEGDPDLPPITRAITALGPAYIKFGQIMSTRPDVVGEEMAEQLSFLQDRLPPFSREEARAAVEAEFGQPVEAIYASFSEPVAAASIAQVHRAVLRDTGEDVAVKIVRPGIEAAFRRDLNAFWLAAGIIETLSPGSRRLRPKDVVAHFQSVVLGELDLRLEAASSAEFAENTKDDAKFIIPKVNWNWSGREILTSTWMEGIPMRDVAAIDAAGINRKQLAERILQLFLSHALRDGFFHGDMHQGNLKASLNGDVIAFDFGIMGEIDEYTRRVYAEIIIGFINRDYRRVARVHFEAGYVPADQDEAAFARALRVVGEPIFGADASEISMAKLLAYLFEVTERFGMPTRTELILLQRTMVVVEGVARSLYPQINMWETARPVVENYIRDTLGPRAIARDGRRILNSLAKFGPRLPALIDQALAAQMANRTIILNRAGMNRNAVIWSFLAALTGLIIGLAIG